MAGFRMEVPDIVSTFRIDTKRSLADGEREAESGGKRIAKGLAIGLAAGAAVIAAAATKVIGDAVDEASGYVEALNKTGVVFGPQAKDIKAWAEQADAIGLSDRAALAAAGNYGNLFRALGLTQKKSATYSKSLTNLAADLASFNDTSIDDAIEALQSGLTGETEPLKKFGINMNEATIKAAALSEGLVKADVDMGKVRTQQLAVAKATAAFNKVSKDAGATNLERADAANKVQVAEAALSSTLAGKVGDLTAAQKAQAAYALIMDQTKLAQGDFERSSSTSLANQRRKLDAVTADLKKDIGLIFLPGALRFTTFLSGKVIPALRETVAYITPAIKRFQAFQDTMVTSVGKGAKDAFSFFKTDALPLIKEFAGYISDELVPVFLDYVNMVKTEVVPVIKDLVTEYATRMLPIIQKVVAIFRDSIVPIFQTFAGILINTVIPAVLPFVRIIATNLIQGITGMYKAIVEKVGPALKKLAQTVIDNKEEIGAFAAGVARFAGAVAVAVSWVAKHLLPVLGKFIGFLAEGAIGTIQAVIKVIGGVVRGVQAFARFLADAYTAAETFVAKVKEKFATFKKKVGDAFDAVNTGIGNVITWFTDLPGNIWDALQGLISGENSLYQMAVDTVDGFIQGLADKAGDIVNAVKEFITDKVPGPIKDALGIHSPSRVTRALGGFTGEGMALGLRDQAGNVYKSAQAMANAAAKGSLVPTVAPRVQPAYAGVAGAGGGGVTHQETHFHLQEVLTGDRMSNVRTARALAKRTERL